MESHKRVWIDKNRFAIFKKILESRTGQNFTTESSALAYLLEDFRELLYPDFEKYYDIETKVSASLVLSSHQAKHFIKIQISELNFLANCINILFLDYLNSEVKVQKAIEVESGLKRMIAYQYALNSRKKEVNNYDKT